MACWDAWSIFQEHPFEGFTNYTALVCVRCNFEAQDLRRILISYAPSEMPGIGDRPAWSWMNAGVIPRSLPEQCFPNEEVLLALALLEQKHERDGAQPFRVREGDLRASQESGPHQREGIQNPRGTC